MISYSVYKVMHLLGVLMVFLSLGGVTTHIINGGERQHGWRKQLATTHGLGLLLSLVGGFGLLARMGVMHGAMPGWAVAKIVIWVVFALAAGVLLRKASLAKSIWILTIVLGGTAAYLAGNKPF